MNQPKIVQIALEGETESTYTRLFALCDDGRVFVKYRPAEEAKEESWQQIEPINFADWEED